MTYLSSSLQRPGIHVLKKEWMNEKRKKRKKNNIRMTEWNKKEIKKENNKVTNP